MLTLCGGGRRLHLSSVPAESSLDLHTPRGQACVMLPGGQPSLWSERDVLLRGGRRPGVHLLFKI